MQLYELPQGKMFTLNEQPKQPPGIQEDADEMKHYTLKNIDGMYSYVYDIYGNVYHFAAWTEVTPYEFPLSDTPAI